VPIAPGQRLREIEAQASPGDVVKSAVKRALASGRPDVGAIAQELGLSNRTLQRRLAAEGTKYRLLFTEARQELSSPLLADTSFEIEEVAFLPGYQDTNSFHRAFRQWDA
jgi:AraC-like DNA-binding protein